MTTHNGFSSMKSGVIGLERLSISFVSMDFGLGLGNCGFCFS